MNEFSAGWATTSGYFLMDNLSGLSGLLNSKGDTIAPFIYNSLIFDKTGKYLIFSKNRNNYGLMDLSGKIIFRDNYYKIQQIGENEIFILQKQANSILYAPHSNLLLRGYSYLETVGIQKYIIAYRNGKEGILDLNGKVIVPIEYEKIQLSEDNQFFLGQKENKTAFLTIDQKIIFPYKYKTLSFPFENGAFIVSEGGKYSIIDSQGNPIYPFEYRDISPFDMVGFKGELKEMVFPNGKHFEILESKVFRVDNKEYLAITLKNNKIGIYDFLGNEILPFDYDYFRITYRGNLILAKNGKYCFSTLDQLKNAKFIYESIRDYYTDIKFGITFLVKSNGKMGLIDSKEKILFPFQYDSLSIAYSEDSLFLLAKKDGAFGLVTAQNKTVVPFEYENVLVADSSYFYVFKNGKMGMIDRNNKLIIPYGMEINDGIKIIGDNIYYMMNGAFGAVNKKGEPKLPFDYIVNFNQPKPLSDYRIEVGYQKSTLKLVIIDLQKAKILVNEFDKIDIIDNKTTKVFKNNKWAIADANFKPISKFEYDQIGKSLGFYFVEKGKYTGVLDSNLHLVIPVEYKKVNFLGNNKFFYTVKDSITTIFDLNFKKYCTIPVGDFSYNIYNDSLFQLKDSYFKTSKIHTSKIKPGQVFGRANKVVVPFICDNIRAISSGLLVTKNKKIGFCNAEGKMVLDTLYESITDIQNYLIVCQVKDNERYYGLFTSKGKMVFPIKYSYISIENSLILIKKVIDVEKNIIKYGAFNLKLEEVSPFIYDYITASIVNKQLFLIKLDKKFGIMDSKGTVIIPIEYNSLDWSKVPNQIIAKKDWDYGIIDLKNNIIVPFEYFKIGLSIEEPYEISRDGKEGTMDETGAEHFPVDDIMYKYGAFDEIKSDFMADSIMAFRMNKLWGFATKQGQIIINPKYIEVKDEVLNDAMIVSIGGRYGVVYMGQEVLPCTYEQIIDVSSKGKYAIVKKGDKMGMVNFKNKIIVPFEYDSISLGVGDNAIVKKDFKYGVVDLKNYLILPLIYNQIVESEECFLIVLNEKYGIADSMGKILLSPKYDKIYPFDNGVAYTIEGQKGFNINHLGVKVSQESEKQEPPSSPSGKVLIDGKWKFSYMENWEFVYKDKLEEYKKTNKSLPNYLLIDVEEGYAVAKIEQKYGLIDANEKIIIPFEFDGLLSPHDGLLAVKKGEKWGVINLNQKQIVPYLYDALKIVNGFIEVEIQSQNGLLNKNGEVIIPTEYNTVETFPLLKNRFIVSKESKYGIINDLGKFIVPPIYKNIQIFDENNFYVIDNSSSGFYINSKGERIAKPFQNTQLISEEYQLIVNRNNTMKLLKRDSSKIVLLDNVNNTEIMHYVLSEELIGVHCTKGYYGFVDLNGDFRIEPKFDFVKPFKNGYAAVKKSGKWAYIDKYGSEITSFDFDFAGQFSKDGYAVVGIYDKMGVINMKGEVVVPFIYYYNFSNEQNGNYDFDQKFISVFTNKKMNKCQFINSKGNVLFGGRCK